MVEGKSGEEEESMVDWLRVRAGRRKCEREGVKCEREGVE